MCLGSIYWSRVDDEHLYAEVAATIADRELPMKHLLGDEGCAPPDA